jgi:hypothetical protein
MVRLPSTDSDEAICPSGYRGPAQELQFASLIAAHAQTGEIITFDP